MTEHRDEFERLLDETLAHRVNAPAPIGIEARALRRLDERAAAFGWSWWPRRAVLVLAAAVVLMVVAGLVGRFRTAERTAPKVASVDSSQPLRGALEASRPGIANEVRVKNLRPTATRAHVRTHLRTLRSKPFVRVRRDERPKLDIFPSTAIHPPTPAPGSMEAQLRVLTSLPPASLELLAEAQAKDEAEMRKESALPLN